MLKNVAAFCGSMLLLAGCGGGSSAGTSKTATLNVNVSTLSARAGTSQGAPTAGFLAFVSTSDGSSVSSFYVAITSTTNGIASITQSQPGPMVSVTFKPPATLGPGKYSDTITIKGCTDQSCSRQVGSSPQTVSVVYTVTVPQPQFQAMQPSSVAAGAATFTLTLTGSAFTQRSTAFWDGNPLPTTYVSPTMITAQVSDTYVQTPGNCAVTASNTSDGTDDLTPLTMYVRQLGSLALNRLSPQQVEAGAESFYLSAIGTGFTGHTTVLWNGAPLPTRYLSDTVLRASVSADLLASVSSATITASDPRGNVGPLSVAIVPPSVDAVSYRITPGGTGAITFRSASLPSSSLWSVNFSDTVSYALIAGGRVIVSTSAGTTSQVLALDAGTGMRVWGPIAFSGPVLTAYDNGTVFVVAGSIVTAPPVLTALDAQTGTARWSSKVNGASDSPSPPVATNGVVYVVNEGEVQAYDEASGKELWEQGTDFANGSVAASADGVYASSACSAFAFVPYTGDPLWSNSTGCTGLGEVGPVVANGRVYAPLQGVAYFGGTTFDSETGTVLGNFTAQIQPAVTRTAGYWLSSQTLQGIGLANNQLLWSFTGDGRLVTAPVVVNNYVFIGSGAGKLYAVDATSGAQLWVQTFPAGFDVRNGQNPWIGLTAGDGLLAVPTGTTLTVFQLSTNP